MKNKQDYITLLVILFFSVAFSQNKNGARVMLSTNGISSAKHYVYTPSFKAKAIYKKMEDAKNQYPEQLMSSILSASTQEWINYNTLGGAENAEIKDEAFFTKAKNVNVEKTYFELLSKLEFIANGNEMLIMKFYLHHEDKELPTAGAHVMQKSENGWKRTSTPYTTSMAMALMVFKADVMGRLLLGKGSNETENNLINRIYDDSGLSIDKLLKQKLSDSEKEELTNPLNW